MNGSRFYSTTSQTSTKMFNAKNKPVISRKPSSSSNSSSPLSNKSGRSLTNGNGGGGGTKWGNHRSDHHMPAPISSTTAYLLAGKSGNAPSYQTTTNTTSSSLSNSHFSKSLMNVSSAKYFDDNSHTNGSHNSGFSWNTNTGNSDAYNDHLTTQQSTNIDLLTGIGFNPAPSFSSPTRPSHYRYSYHSSDSSIFLFLFFLSLSLFLSFTKIILSNCGILF